jgi:5-oxoprolinase (ATP-hydrolysing) subunit A
MTAVDLNCDMGESYGIWTLGADHDLLSVVTSANLACGFHAGDPTTLRTVTQDAVTQGVAVGAQVSFPDLAGFGRRAMQIDPGELRDLVLYQIAALDGFMKVLGSRVAYVKPHGALYHVTVSDPDAAAAVVAAAAEFDSRLAILGFPDSELLRAAERFGLRPVVEAFADRAYLPDGRLQPRSIAGSVLTDPAEILQRTLRLVNFGEILTTDGTAVHQQADSICVHSDTPQAVTIARELRAGLEAHGVKLQTFISGPSIE